MSGTVGPRLSTIPPTFFNDYSFEFDGTDDFVVSVPTLMGAYNTAIIRSFSFWVKINSGTYVPFFCGKNGGAAPFPRYSCGSGVVLGRLQWALDYYRASSAYCRAYSELIDGTGDPTKNILDGNWHHIVIYNPVDSTTNRANIVNCKMWLDGQPLTVLNDGAPYGTNAVRGLGSALQIGVGSTGSHSGQDYLNGNIDEFSYFDNYELTNDDVTAIYNSGSPTNLSDLTTPPTSWYRNGDNGTWKSPQWLIPSNENKDKVSNYSFDFDGVDDRISISEVVFSSSFTFSFWVKPANLTNAFVFGDIISNSYFVWLFSTTQVWLKTNSGSYAFSESGGNNIVVDSWQHITITRDGSNNINCYRNGLAFGSSSTLAGNFELNSIGEVYSAINSWRLNGGLDEFAVWDSVQDASTIYNSGVPTDISSLSPLAWYRMGEEATFSGGVWAVPDQVGSNDGASVNMGINDRVGDAPGSENNASSINMVLSGRTSDVPT